MMKVDFGFGIVECEPLTKHKLKVVASEDPMMPVGTVFPVKDIEVLEAKVVE